MATKPEFLVAKEKMLVALATVSVAILSPVVLKAIFSSLSSLTGGPCPLDRFITVISSMLFINKKYLKYGIISFSFVSSYAELSMSQT